MMNDLNEDRMPSAWERVRERSADMGFDMPSDSRTGALLMALAASKPMGNFLELLAGMDIGSKLTSLDLDPACMSVAQAVLGADPRLTLLQVDVAAWLKDATDQTYDLIFADAWPGKYSDFSTVTAMLKPGGMYLVDDMLPQPNWPDGHAQAVSGWLNQLDALPGYCVVRLAWSTGIVLLVRRS